MARVISPIDINTETFLDWVIATNTAIDVISANAVTTGGIPAVGDAVVTGNIQTDGLFTDTLSGGAIGAPGNLTINTNTTFSSIVTLGANVEFTGANTFLGNYTTITLVGSNTTHNIVGVNPTTSKLEMRSLPTFTVSTAPTVGSTLYWDGTAFRDTNSILVAATTKNVTFANNVIIGGNISANGSFGGVGSLLFTDGNKVYWSNTTTLSWTANGFISTGTANSNFNNNLLFVNTTTQKVGIKTATPNNTFEVVGTLNANVVYSNNSPVWTAANDGASSGLDADLLDGLHANNFILRNAVSNTNSTVTFTAGVITNTVNAVSTTADNIIFNANNFGFSQAAPQHKVDIAGSLRATGDIFFTSNAYFGLSGAINKVGLLDLLKTTGSTLGGNATISTDGTKITFYENGGTRRGAFIDLSSTGASVDSSIWHSGSATLLNNANGYQRLPNGFIMQWGRANASTSAGNTRSITFPLAFTTACYNVQVTALDSGTHASGLSSTAFLTGFTFINSSGGTISDFYWFAVGV